MGRLVRRGGGQRRGVRGQVRRPDGRRPPSARRQDGVGEVGVGRRRQPIPASAAAQAIVRTKAAVHAPQQMVVVTFGQHPTAQGAPKGRSRPQGALQERAQEHPAHATPSATYIYWRPTAARIRPRCCELRTTIRRARRHTQRRELPAGAELRGRADGDGARRTSAPCRRPRLLKAASSDRAHGGHGDERRRERRRRRLRLQGGFRPATSTEHASGLRRQECGAAAAAARTPARKPVAVGSRPARRR